MIKELYHKLLRLRRWKRIVWDSNAEYDIPFGTRLKYARKGFDSNEYVCFDLAHNDCAEYISEYERLESREINGDYKFILDNKLVFEEIFSKYTRVPKNYAMISDGEVYALHGAPIDNERFLPFLHAAGKTILKWTDRGGGLGTYLFEAEGDHILVNGKVGTPEEIESLRKRKGNALLCEYITQSAFAASLYPHTANTMRIVCARKKGERDCAVIAACQRIGCAATIPVDNAHAGGLACSIDLQTGTLSYGIPRFGDMDRRMKKFEKHPDTGAQIAGKVIPGWEQLKAEVVELTNRLPYLNFVAWDILLTEEGFCVIEGNASSGCGIFQLEHGARNGPLGDIYRSYGVIS